MIAKDILYTYFYKINYSHLKKLNIFNKIVITGTWGGYFKTKNMKLYTEEQLVRAMSIAVYNKYEKYIEVLDLLTPIELPSWISIIDSLPNPLQTVWISNGKGWTTLGCISEAEEGDDGRFYWHWCQTNGVIYQDNEEIVSECEGDDLDVLFWHPLPKPILNQNK